MVVEWVDVIAVQEYLEQVGIWPREGRHVMAHFHEETIVVYQEYNRAIGRYVVEDCESWGN